MLSDLKCISYSAASFFFWHAHIFKSLTLRQTDIHTYLLGIQDDLGELTSLCKALDDFVGHVCSQVDTQSQGGIHCFHQVTQFL